MAAVMVIRSPRKNIIRSVSHRLMIRLLYITDFPPIVPLLGELMFLHGAC